jgi:hypothetical protein
MNELIHDILLFLHFVGLASLIGGLLVQVRAAGKVVNAPVLYGAIAQLVTGLVLMFLELDEINHIKVAVKFAVLAVIIVVGLVRRRRGLTGGLFWAMLALSLANVGVAVFW